VQTAFALREAEESFAKFGVQVGEARLDLAKANEWKAAVVKQMTGGVASLFKANNVTWFQGSGRFEDQRSIAFDKGDIGVSFSRAIVATGSFPIRPPIEGLDSPRCVDSTGLLAQTEVPKRLVVLGGGIIGCEFASIFERFGTEVTMIEMLDALIPQEDADATSELRKSFARRGIVVHLGKQCTKVEDTESGLLVHFGEGETTECDLMLVSVGRAPLVDGIGLEAAGVTFDPRSGIGTDAHRRTSVEHIYAAGDVAGYWQLAHTGFREGEIAAENATGHEAEMPESPAVPRPIYTDPEIAGVGLTESEAVERFGAENIAVGRFPWIANARAVMTGETAGWVKSIHETTYGELVGVVIVGPHATDLIEAAVVALDAEATIETVADGMAPHPTLSEGLKEAGLVALGRAIHLPPRRR
jgi:dihydrolipoamide dehydrogenase